jgi:uncharacterized protein (TIGR02594 family)
MPLFKSSSRQTGSRKQGFKLLISFQAIGSDNFDFDGGGFPAMPELPIQPRMPVLPQADDGPDQPQQPEADGTPERADQPKAQVQPEAEPQPQAEDNNAGAGADEQGADREQGDRRSASAEKQRAAQDDDVPAAASAKDSGPEPGADGKAGSARGAKALAVARQEIGTAEDPPGSNRGPRVNEYQGGDKGQYWCAHFVSWCFEQSGGSPFGHEPSVAELRRWAEGKGKYVTAGSAAPGAGDVFTMQRRDKAGKVVGGHTGFIQSYDAKKNTVRTVEGNISDKVGELTRSVASLDGFVRI